MVCLGTDGLEGPPTQSTGGRQYTTQHGLGTDLSLDADILHYCHPSAVTLTEICCSFPCFFVFSVEIPACFSSYKILYLLIFNIKKSYYLPYQQYKLPWWCCAELSDSVLVILCTTNTSIIREKAHSDGIQSKWEKSSSRPLQMQLVV